MTPLTQTLLSKIADDDEEGFLGAEETALAFFFGIKPLIDPYGDLLTEHPPAVEDLEALKTALVDYVRSGPGKHTGTAVWALGKFQDPKLVPLLREQLSIHLRIFLQQNHIIGNLICALDNHGESVLSENHFSSLEVDKNIADARRYLQLFGEVIPG